MNIKLGKTLSFLLFLMSSQAFATAYKLPPANHSIVGRQTQGTVGIGDTVAKIQLRYDVGFNEIQKANPQLNVEKGLMFGSTVKIPTQHLIPDQPREGIIVNLPEMRMYYFPKGTDAVYTYPIGIGKIGKTIPIATATVTKKVKDPIWVPPDDIREFQLAQGVVLPQIMPAGPDNPLGPYAIYMTIPTFLFHSTIFPESIGKRASFGCIRMYESDIQTFFPSVESGVPVVIMNTPIKFGWQGDRLYVEAHPTLEEHAGNYESTLPGIVREVARTTKNQPMLIDWQGISFAASERDGVPHEIGVKIPKA